MIQPNAYIDGSRTMGIKWSSGTVCRMTLCALTGLCLYIRNPGISLRPGVLSPA